MKRTLTVLSVLLALLMALTVTALADNTRYVYDGTGLLSEQEAQQLQEKAAQVSERYGCGIYLAMLPDMQGFTDIEYFTESAYSSWDLGLGDEKTGILLMLSMAGRDFDIAAYGSLGHYAFTDYGKSVMADEFLDDFRYDDWFEGFSDYIGVCDYFLSLAAQGTPYDVPGAAPARVLTTQEKLARSVPLGLILGVISALIYCSVLKSRMKSAVLATNADDYKASGVNMRVRQDSYTHSTTSRVRIETESGRTGGFSGGGGTHISSSGFSHHSGKF